MVLPLVPPVTCETVRFGMGARVADAARGEAIQRIQDALLLSPRQVFQVSRSLAGVADSHG